MILTIELSDMNCPAPIARVLVEILKQGILQTRAAAWAGDAEACSALTDHLHNLPDLLMNYSDDRLIFYWEAERQDFLSRVAPDMSAPYGDYWDELQTQLELAETAK